jgi:hypothetical protein
MVSGRLELWRGTTWLSEPDLGWFSHVLNEVAGNVAAIFEGE